MEKLGTYTTMDSPVASAEIKEDALTFLREKFSDIGGIVRKFMNPHDFGEYPSFEIDYPEFLEEHSGDDCVTCEVGEECPLDSWHTKANAIETEYSQRFADYL